MGEFDLFGKMEQEGWSDPARASGYIDLFAPASDQAIHPLLDAVDAKSGMLALDLCCGQGNVSEALISRGCDTTGLDFSPAMLDHARRRVPKAAFHEGDAQNLPFNDGQFDIVVSNLGICHVPDQPKALKEASRVLKPGGRFAMTVWCGPDKSPGFGTVYEVIGQHGSPDVSPPPGPDFHQYANPSIAQSTLEEAGFREITFQTVPCTWTITDPDGLFQIFKNGTVRAAMLLANQPQENLDAIRSELRSLVEQRFIEENHWKIPVPAALVSATV